MKKASLGVALLVILTGAAASHGAVDLQYDVVTEVPPPPPQLEMRTPSPGPGFAWIAGYWMWNNTRHSWVPGTWVEKPRPFSTWLDGHWQRQDRAWVWISGRWKD